MKRAWSHWFAAAVVPLVLCFCGCQGIAWLVAQFAPPQKVPATYKLPKGKKVLVFVDDPYYRVNYEPVKAELTKRLNSQLTTHKIAAKTIPYRRLLGLIDATPDFNRLRVSQVGKKLGADVVLYVQVDRFSLKDHENSTLWHGRFKTTIRFVDNEANRLWPKDMHEGFPVPEVTRPQVDNASPTYGGGLARIMAEKMADRIAKLFYDHTVPVLATEDEK